MMNNLVCHSGMTLLNHGEGICPTGPVCCHARPPGAAQAQTTKRERQRGCDLRVLMTCVRWDPQNRAQTGPHALIMGKSKLSHPLGTHHAQQVIGSSRCTMQQEEPSGLHIRNCGDGFQQHVQQEAKVFVEKGCLCAVQVQSECVVPPETGDQDLCARRRLPGVSQRSSKMVEGHATMEVRHQDEGHRFER